MKPIDLLFFRDGKPFTMGDDTWASGNIIPAPSVIYGALKAAYYSVYPDEFEKISADNDPASENITVEGIYFRFENSNFFPLPLDYVYEKNKSAIEKRKEKRDGEYQVKLLEEPVKRNFSSADQFKLSISDEEVETLDNGLITELDLGVYLRNFSSAKEINAIKLDDLIVKEPKIGIGRENTTHTTAEGKLYRVGMIRFKNLDLGVKTKENLQEILGLKTKLGGEGKIVEITEDTKDFEIEEVDFSGEISKIKLYLSTPAVFENGWLPKWIDKRTFEGEYNGIKLKLFSAFIGKPQYIGGFDMAKRCPKPMKKVVPAGSVYYFEVLEGNKEELINTFHGKSISEFDTNKQGFGITFLGVL